MNNGLIALKQIRSHSYGTLKEFDVKLSVIEKYLNAFEIIKNKELNIYFVKRMCLGDFNFQCLIKQQLTKDEYKLLKEVLL